MIAVFYDTREASNPLNGTRIRNKEELRQILDSLPKAEPFFCKLEGENGYELLVGVGQNNGCAQYSRSDGEPPYLVALGTNDSDDAECLEFMIGNELTPVPQRRCLPFALAREIAAYFIETGDRSPDVSWEDA